MNGKWLTGNGHWCPACGGTGQHPSSLVNVPKSRLAPCRQIPGDCEQCAGEGRMSGPGPALPPPASANWSGERKRIVRAARLALQGEVEYVDQGDSLI